LEEVYVAVITKPSFPAKIKITQIGTLFDSSRCVVTLHRGSWPPNENWNNTVDTISLRHSVHDTCRSVHLKYPSLTAQPITKIFFKKYVFLLSI